MSRLAGAAAIAVFALAWSLTTEIYAANGEKRASDRAFAILPKPADWVDQTTGRQPTLFVGQGVSDANAFWQLEFWNPSIKWFWGMDGSTPGGVTPNLLRPDGTQDPADLGAEFAVASKGVQIAAPEVTTVGDYVVYRLGGEPVRLTQTTTGVSDDGWMVEEATYTRYDVDDDPKGLVLVKSLARKLPASRSSSPCRVTRAGRAGRGGRVRPARNRPRDGDAGGRPGAPVSRSPWPPLPVPSDPWRVEVTVDPRPSSRASSTRTQPTREQLGAQVSFETRPARRLAAAVDEVGCLRTKRSIPRRCQSVWRVRKRLSITAA